VRARARARVRVDIRNKAFTRQRTHSRQHRKRAAYQSPRPRAAHTCW
jgi:hypothetical protein